MNVISNEVELHYSGFLGKAADEWAVKLADHPAGGYRILRFGDVPCPGASTLATLGLSEAPLHMFRQEFVFLCYDRFLSDDLVSLMSVVAEEIVSSNHPLFHGSVLPPAGPLLEYTSMEALYVGSLMYFNTEAKAFDTFEVNGVSVLISWLIPIYPVEADWIEANGSDAFENLIVDKDPDLMDLKREPFV